MKNYKMNFIELQVTLSICIIFLLRMLGMFMIVPIISTYGIFLKGADHFLLGLAMGIYGIAQILFQFPFGFLSDKFGRKFVMILGLFLFFIGSFITATIHSIWGLIFGRFLQGSGAISGVSMALLSDFVCEKNRAKSLALIGLSFAVSFLISMVSGPFIAHIFGFFSIFWLSVFFSVLCIMIVFFFIPTSNHDIISNTLNIFDKQLLVIIFDKKLIRYYIGIFFLHFLLMMNFMIIPHELEMAGLFLSDHWKLYAITITCSFLCIFLFLFYFKYNIFLDNIIEICIILFFLSDIIFLYSEKNLCFLISAIQIFFICFNMLEVFLPSDLSKKILLPYKGSIMSIYSISQFSGVFLGSFFGGFLLHFLSRNNIFWLIAFFIFLWLSMSLFCKTR